MHHTKYSRSALVCTILANDEMPILMLDQNLSLLNFHFAERGGAHSEHKKHSWYPHPPSHTHTHTHPFGKCHAHEVCACVCECVTEVRHFTGDIFAVCSIIQLPRKRKTHRPSSNRLGHSHHYVRIYDMPMNNVRTFNMRSPEPQPNNRRR